MTHHERTVDALPGPGVPANVTNEKLLSLATAAAIRASAELLARAGRTEGIGYKSTVTDPVSDADRASESVIAELITAERPQDGLLGEEGAEQVGSSGYRWVIDPLDGTVNYLYGIPHSAISIACEQWDGQRWRAVAGLVHDPVRQETFAAARGAGANAA